MRKLLKKYCFVPDKLITDDLRSYAAAASDLGIAKRHERGRWCNNRAENSHQPTCQTALNRDPGSVCKRYPFWRGGTTALAPGGAGQG
ncbi:MAG: hypothetical protein WA624_10915, partial [Methylocella sp.]